VAADVADSIGGCGSSFFFGHFWGINRRGILFGLGYFFVGGAQSVHQGGLLHSRPLLQPRHASYGGFDVFFDAPATRFVLRLESHQTR